MSQTPGVIENSSSNVAWAVERFGSRTTGSVRLAFADAEDPRTQEAVGILAATGLVEPVVVGGPEDVSWPEGVHRIALDDSNWGPRISEAWAQRQRSRPQVGSNPIHTEEIDPLLFLALGVKLGLAEAGVAGASSTSSSVIRAGLHGLGVIEDGGLVSGVFLVGSGETLWTWSDCSVVPEPDAEQLASIAHSAATLHQQVSGERPLVAMLSFSTAGSADHPAARKVQSALSILRRDYPNLDADGEMQFDAAIDPGVGELKFPDSTVAGCANVFVFPNLNAGNIAYKVAQRVGRARILGSFVLGLARPWVDLSRGCTTEEIVGTALALRAIVSSTEILDLSGVNR
jgi:phosphate acetyltransferase